MRNIFYRIIDYKEIHPIRFWVIIIGLSLIFLASIYVLKKVIQNKNNSKNNFASENLDNQIEKNDKKISIFFIKHKILIGFILLQFIVILAFSTSLF